MLGGVKKPINVDAIREKSQLKKNHAFNKRERTMKRICIHQPDFMPYLGFFHRFLLADTFIVLDDAQFLRKGSGWHNRDLIKTKQGQKWLSLSVQKGKLHQKINEVLLNNTDKWIHGNLNLLRENYRKSPYFNQYFNHFEEIYLAGHRRLLDLNMAFLIFFFDLFDLTPDIIFSSRLQVEGGKNSRLVNLIKAVNGTNYYSGIGSKEYLDEELFNKEGITVEWQQFEHPVYPQLHGDFLPNLSCLDLLFNCGPGSKKILLSTHSQPCINRLLE